MLSVEEAQNRVLKEISPLSPITVSCQQAVGRVLAQDILAPFSQPATSRSVMDGYAVRACEISDRQLWKIMGEIQPSENNNYPMPAGSAWRIFTGATLPADADCVIRQEDVTLTSKNEFTFTPTIATEPISYTTGQFVRQIGSDYHKGKILLTAGTTLHPPQLGLLGSAGITEIAIIPRPKIGILATGNEILLPGNIAPKDKKPEENFDANSYILAGLIQQTGAESHYLGVCPDRPAALQQVFRNLPELDGLVISGGMSVGNYDLVAQSLEDIGFARDFWRIAMRPGKPLLFGKLQNMPVFGFPGNPVSAYMCGLIFLLPALAKLQGHSPFAYHRYFTAEISHDFPQNGVRQAYLRAEYTVQDKGDSQASPPTPRKISVFSQQDSARLYDLAQADCLVIRPPHAPALHKGDKVCCLDIMYSL